MENLITDGAHFIGRLLTEKLLAKKQGVRLLAPRRTGIGIPESEGLEIVPLKIFPIEKWNKLLDGVKTIYYLEGAYPFSRKGSVFYFMLMKTILDILQEQGSKVRLVYVSSIAVQGIPREVPATEDTPTIISLRDLHTQHKERCEQLLKEYAVRYGLAATILRHPIVYGRKDLPVESLLKLLRRPGRIAVPYIGPGNYLTPFIHSEDFVQALLLAAEKEEAVGEIYNIVDDDRISFRLFLEEIASILGVRLMFINLPKILLRPITSALDWGGALLKFPVGSRRFLEYLTVSLAYENQKMKKHLELSLRFPTVKEGLDYTFKAHFDRKRAEVAAH